MNYNVVLIAEPQVQRQLVGSLEYISNDFFVSGVGKSIQEGKELIRNNRPDLVIIQCNLSDGDGYEVFEGNSQHPFEKIFLVESGLHALRALKFSGLGSVLLPLNESDFRNVLNKFISLRASFWISNAYHNASQMASVIHLSRIAFPTNRGTRFLPTHQILWVRKYKNNSVVKLLDGKIRELHKPFSEVLKLLFFNGFFPLSQKKLINLTQIKELSPDFPFAVVMSDNEVVRMSPKAFARLGALSHPNPRSWGI